MKRNNQSFVRRAHNGQRGQMLFVVALALAMFLGFVGFVIDVGQLYYSYSELQSSTDAAALAGAQDLPNTSAPTTATAYSGVSGNLNARPNLPNVTMATGYPKLLCLTALTNLAIPCVGPANAPTGANAISVRQQVSVSTSFMKVLGAGSLTLTTTATAAMRGGGRSPYNVAIIVDTTASMNNTDSDSNCGSTRIGCALSGVQTLLSEFSPCSSSMSSCGSVTRNSGGGGGNVANAVDRVTLYTFPAVTTATYADDYNCSRNPTIASYQFSFPTTSTYQIVNFSSDYRTSDTATSLSSSSNLVTAVGTTKSNGCLQAIGGEGTYYAQVIDQAQAALVAEQATYPNTQNVLILLGDGDSNATCTRSSGGICQTGDMPGASTTTGTYVNHVGSTVNECHQAITVAQAATAAGTTVYTVAYGAKASGCSTDSPAITPCTTMQQMASKASTFFSDYTATGSDSTCISASRPTSSLNQIFTEIAGDLTVARLIPNNLN